MKNYHEMAEDLFQRRDCYLAERKRKMNLFIKTVSGISCFCLAALWGIRMINTGTTPESQRYVSVNPVPLEVSAPDPQADSSDGNNVNRLESLRESINGSVGTDSAMPENSPDKAVSDKEASSDAASSSAASGDTEPGDADPGDAASGNAEPGDTASGDAASGDAASSSAASDNAEPDNAASGGTDVPVSEQSPGSLQAVTVSGNSSYFFGGSYTDAQGRLCILLTENTPENRAAVCRELGINEISVVFQNASYTLSYLTELQARISQGMISRELNFVIVSSLREDTNRIHLTVTTDDESLLEKLRSLDSLGGALEIEYSPDSMTKNLLAVPE